MGDKEIKQIAGLISGMQRDDPRLYRVLSVLIDNLDLLFADIQLIRDGVEPDIPVVAPTNFTYELKFRSISLTWTRVAGANEYELREGTVWETAELITRVANTGVELVPRPTGSYDFLLKAINFAGKYSMTAASLLVEIPPIPNLNVTVQVIDNNVLLKWDEPDHPFEIVHYHITKDGIDVGEIGGTFFVIFESASGTYEYGITAHHIGGSHSAEALIQATVSQPPDYIIEDVQISIFDGTLVNCYLIVALSRLVACIDVTETWEDFFDNNSWADFQDAIDAGYPIYAQPTLTSGSYEEVFDFGSIFTSIIVNINYNITTIAGSVIVTPKIAVSDDDITYTSFSTGPTFFADSARYVKIRLEFVSSDDLGVIELSDLRVGLSVKREMDGGTVSVLAADSGGTVVAFNKAFKDIESITVTPFSTVEQVAIYDFVDAPNPTDFKILLFNTSGARIDGTVSWQARGIL